MDLSIWKEVKKQKKMTIADIAIKAGLPKGTVQNIFAGYVPSPRLDTVQAIERALGLSEQEKKSIMDRPASDIAENFIRENMELIKEKAFNDLTKLYKVMTETQKLYIVAYIVGMLTNAGIDTKSIVGY